MKALSWILKPVIFFLGYSGYRLTNLGYDYLALHTLIKSGQISDLGSMIGVGKESDVYLSVAGENCGRRDEQLKEGDCKYVDKQEHFDPPASGDYIVIKFHRLGRISFRKVREKREYHQGRNTCSWLYLDRLAAKREFEMMEVGFIMFVSIVNKLCPCDILTSLFRCSTIVGYPFHVLWLTIAMLW